MAGTKRDVIRWGIIGCGDVTEVKSGPALQKAEGSRLVAVMRRTAALAEDYARRHNVPKWTTDAQALIHDEQVDAVYVATPPGTHLEYALAVCRAGKPCYVEKPMARSFEEAWHMVRAFQAAGLPLFVAYYRRGLPRFRKAKELLDAGRIGRITEVSYRFASASHRKADVANRSWRFQAEHSGGGLFMDLGSHTLDILDFLCGPLDDVAGDAANLTALFAVEDAVAMHYRLASGAVGTACWNFVAGAPQDLIRVAGTEGEITLSTFGNEPVRLQTPGGAETFDLPNPPHIQQPLIQTLVDELRGKGRCPSTGQSAARTARVMDAALESYYGSRTGPFWENPDRWPGRKNKLQISRTKSQTNSKDQ